MTQLIVKLVEIRDLVLLKLQGPAWDIKCTSKPAPKLHGLLIVLKKVGYVAYDLALLLESKLNPFFDVSS